MSSCSEADCSPVLVSRELSEFKDCATVEAGDVKGFIEKLSQLGTVRVAIFEEKEAREWFQKVQSVWKITWRVQTTVPGGKKNIFKTNYKCQHNVQRAYALKGKNTNCPARLALTLKHTELAKDGKSKSKDALLSSHPLIATLHGEHNHAIDTAAALKHRDVNAVEQDGVMTYTVNNLVDQSSCAKGINGGPCEHQFAAYELHGQPSVYIIPQSSDERYRLQYFATGQYAAPPAWFTSLHGNIHAVGTAEAPSSSEAHASGQSEASPAQHAPDEGLRASEPALPPVLSGLEQGSEEGASQDSIDEWQQVVNSLCAFIVEEAASPEGRKCLAAMNRTVKRLGRGPALHNAMLAFGQKTVPSLRATKCSTTIGVQPTAVARRKMPLGGRKRIHAGRPVSAAQSADRLLQLAKRRKAPAPHSLSQCVDSNQSLGKAH